MPVNSIRYLFLRVYLSLTRYLSLKGNNVILIPDVYLKLLSGGNHDIDVDDLKNNTRYTGGYTEGSRAVKLFWEVYTQ